MKKIKNKFIDSTLIFKTAIISFIITVLIVVICAANFVLSVKNIQKNNQAVIEQKLTNLIIQEEKKTYKISVSEEAKDYIQKLTDDNYASFLIKYNENQANWLNGWLTGLTILLAFIGLVAPLCFMKLYDDKKKQMDEIIECANKEKEKTKLNVKKMERQLKIVGNKSKQASEDLEKVKNYLNEINIASEQTTKDLVEVKRYVNEMRAITKYNEGLSKLRESEKDDLKYDEALQLYLDANELDPDNAKYLYAIGNLYLYRQEIDNAINYLTFSINLEATAKCYKDLALAYEAKKDYNKAMEYINMSINAEDSNYMFKVKAESFKILLYSELKDKENVIKYAEQLQKQSIESHIIYANLGLAYMNVEKYEYAIALLEKCNKKYPTQKEYYNLTEAYIYTGKFEKAWNLIQESLKDEISKFTYIYTDDYEKWLNILNNVKPQTDIIVNIKGFVNNKLEKKERKYCQ